MSREVYLFFDETGSRQPNRQLTGSRRDVMDCFGLGGILINNEDIQGVLDAHQTFCRSWNIDCPLHSYEIRGCRDHFSWLRNIERAANFQADLSGFLVNLPVIGIGAIIHRPGYVKRYASQYDGRLWYLDKTAYSILIERSAKYARSKGRRLRVFFEASGRQEDREIVTFMKGLKQEGMPFIGKESDAYHGLTANDFREWVIGEPKRRTKQDPMLQIADLYLYPMAKAGYDSQSKPYCALMNGRRLIDANLALDERPILGTKYSCFDGVGSDTKR